MKEEIWKDIKFEENGIEYDFTGLYQVSNQGRIKSLGNGNNTNAKEKILKPGKNNSGYLFVRLCKDGNVKKFFVHRLIAHIFVDGYFDGAEVDHINTNPSDNRTENLRWVTNKDNKRNQITKKHYSEAKTGENHPMYGKHHSEESKEKMSKAKRGQNNPNSKKVIGYSLTETKVIILQSTGQGKFFGFDSGHICKCCNGKRKSHKDFKWFYLNDNKNKGEK